MIRRFPPLPLKTACLTMVFACLLASFSGSPAAAAEKPSMTQPLAVAMLYQKLLHREPHFKLWVESTPEYTNAELYERVQIMHRDLAQMEKTFKLLSPVEAVVVNTFLPLAPYDPKTRTFLIRDFHELTFFNYAYLGTDYALVPHDIKNRRHIRVSRELAEIIWKEAEKGARANLQITLQPRSADADPVALMGKNLRLIMMDISKIDLWSRDGTRLLWSSLYNSADPVQNDLLTLHP